MTAMMNVRIILALADNSALSVFTDILKMLFLLSLMMALIERYVNA